MLSLVISCACSYVGAMSEKIVDQLLCRMYPCRKVHYPVMAHYTVHDTMHPTEVIRDCYSVSSTAL